MIDQLDAANARAGLIALPAGTSHGEPPDPKHVYAPPSHVKAMDPDAMLVTGMRGSGKTFWWAALQDSRIRELVYRSSDLPILRKSVTVRAGFGVRPEPDSYPDKDTLVKLMRGGREPRMIWRATLAWQMAPDSHPIRSHREWMNRVDYVEKNPEAMARLLYEVDDRLANDNEFLVVLFDALDRCADEWEDVDRLVRGLMQVALDTRPYRRLRVKIFLRSDQFHNLDIADFPDASKITSSSFQLNWTSRDLYNLMSHNLMNGPKGDVFRAFFENANMQPIFVRLVHSDDFLRKKFDLIAGRWMGRSAKRGFPYTWIPNHLRDAKGRVSPRSFLAALKSAAEHTAEHYPNHEFALHFEGIKRGVRKASEIRVSEIREDYPWMDIALEPLAGLNVPLKFKDIEECWRTRDVLGKLKERTEQDVLPPRIEKGANGIRQDLADLGVFQCLDGDRVNIPDVFRVGYGLGRRGGVPPVR